LDWSTERSKHDFVGVLSIAVPFGDGFIVNLIHKNIGIEECTVVDPKTRGFPKGKEEVPEVELRNNLPLLSIIRQHFININHVNYLFRVDLF
jgi:hypothetical protein